MLPDKLKKGFWEGDFLSETSLIGILSLGVGSVYLLYNGVIGHFKAHITGQESF